MRYWCSDFRDPAWRDIDFDVSKGAYLLARLSDKDDPLAKFVCDHMMREYQVYDADICGDVKTQFAFEIEGKRHYYVGTYSWWIDYDPEWELHDEVYYEQAVDPDFEEIIPN